MLKIEFIRKISKIEHTFFVAHHINPTEKQSVFKGRNGVHEKPPIEWRRRSPRIHINLKKVGNERDLSFMYQTFLFANGTTPFTQWRTRNLTNEQRLLINYLHNVFLKHNAFISSNSIFQFFTFPSEIYFIFRYQVKVYRISHYFSTFLI